MAHVASLWQACGKLMASFFLREWQAMWQADVKHAPSLWQC